MDMILDTAFPVFIVAVVILVWHFTGEWLNRNSDDSQEDIEIDKILIKARKNCRWDYGYHI